MLKTRNYLSGWMDSSIQAFLRDVERPPDSMSQALITCLDSCFDLKAIAAANHAVGKLAGEGNFIGDGLLVGTRKLLAAHRKEQIFFGFDEVWFFAAADIEAKPGGISITGPAEVPDPLPDELADWMDVNKCSLGLGDGTGLNFVAKLSGVARYLVQHWAGSSAGNGHASDSRGKAGVP